MKLAGNIEFSGDEVVLTIRPENIVVKATKGDDSLQCQITSVLPAGSETVIAATIGDTALTLKVNGFTDLDVEDLIWVEFDLSKVNCYDTESEKLLS